MLIDGCCWLWMRKWEIMYEMVRGMNCCRWVNFVFFVCFYDENYIRCGRRMCGRFEWIRCCWFVLFLLWERLFVFFVGSCRWCFGCLKRFLIKLKVKNVKKCGCIFDDEFGCNREKKCFGRRCKSYWRWVMMEVDKVKENVDVFIIFEEDMEFRMEMLSFNDDRSDEDM